MATQTITTLLDTDVLIEILRERPLAKVWLQSNTKTNIAIHGIVAMETIKGSENKNDLQPFNLKHYRHITGLIIKRPYQQ